MNRILIAAVILAVTGCTALPERTTQLEPMAMCKGSVSLPARVQNMFEPIEDTPLLNQALGAADEGKLCQGKVYKSKPGTQLTVYRAWNSTNLKSQFGNWWAFEKPEGIIAVYRSAYEICYQWSPLDKLESCTLKPETKIVVGTGQSAKCSEFLTYPSSDTQQIFIDDPRNDLTDCSYFDGVFQWQ